MNEASNLNRQPLYLDICIECPSDKLISSVSGCSVRQEADSESIQAEVADLPGTYIPLLLDVTDAEAIATAVEKVSLELNGATLGALINNAGILLVLYPAVKVLKLLSSSVILYTCIFTVLYKGLYIEIQPYIHLELCRDITIYCRR